MKDEIPADALKECVKMYGISMLRRLRKMTFDERRQLMTEVNNVGGAMPLHMNLAESEKKLLCFPSWKDGEPQTGRQTIALMVFVLFVQLGENPEMCSSLCEFWPVEEAVRLEKILYSTEGEYANGT